MIKLNRKDLLINLLLGLTISYFLFWRLRLGLVRFFDIDEFAHLHWAYNLLAGLTPYKDYFYFIPPFFLYPLALIFLIFGRSITTILQARILMFFVFLGICLICFLLFKKARNTKIALLAILIMSFLPIPFDKTIEIRPDNIAILFSLIGMYLFMAKWRKNSGEMLFWSGIFYGVSLGFVPKTVFFLVPPLFVLAYKFSKDAKIIDLFSGHQKLNLTFRKNCLSAFKISLKNFLIGLSLPGILVVILLILSGKPFLALLNIIKVSASTTAVLSAKFYMRPDIFFYPNETYYGFGGYHLGYWLNLFIYLFGSLWAVLTMIGFLESEKGERRVQEFLFGTGFFLNLYAFVYIYPLKHAQYLLTILPLLAFYFAAGFENLVNRLTKSVNLRLFFYILLIFLIFISGSRMMSQKAKWSNQKSLERIDYFLKTIPLGEKIFDLTGETIFFPDAYYFCCLPYGQYEEGITYQLPNLESALRKNQVKYVYASEEQRLGVIPVYQAKIVRKFYVKDKLGLYRAGVGINFEYPNDKEEIDLITGGKYSLYWNDLPLDNNLMPSIEADGEVISAGTLELAAGKHIFRASDKGVLIIKYAND